MVTVGGAQGGGDDGRVSWQSDGDSDGDGDGAEYFIETEGQRENGFKGRGFRYHGDGDNCDSCDNGDGDSYNSRDKTRTLVLKDKDGFHPL